MLSVYRHFWHACSFAVSPRISAKFARYEAPILGEHGLDFKMVVVRRLWRFQCQGVDDSCRNFIYIPAKPQPRHIDNIYYIFKHW